MATNHRPRSVQQLPRRGPTPPSTNELPRIFKVEPPSIRMELSRAVRYTHAVKTRDTPLREETTARMVELAREKAVLAQKETERKKEAEASNERP